MVIYMYFISIYLTPHAPLHAYADGGAERRRGINSSKMRPDTMRTFELTRADG